MASKKISQLPDGVALDPADLFVIARAALNYYLTGQDVIDACTFDPSAIIADIVALQNDRLKIDASNGPMTGTLVMSGAGNQFQNPNAPVAGNDLTNKTYVDTMLPLAGGTMSGLLILSGDAVAALGAVTLQQLNAAVAGIVPPADTNDLPEGSDGSAVGGAGIETDGNRYYYTHQRWEDKWTTKDTDDLSEGAVNWYMTQPRFDTMFAAKTTDNLTEGGINLYFTSARARLAISALAPIIYDNVTGIISFSGAVGPTYGLRDEIPFVNVATNDFDYSSNFMFEDDIRLRCNDGTSSVLIGDDNTAPIFAVGATGNVIIGCNAGFQSDTNDSNTFVGYSSGQKEKGVQNTYLGAFAGTSGSAGDAVSNDDNVMVGYRAGHLIGDTSNENVGVGSGALLALTTGDKNTSIGAESGGVLTTGSCNTYIGKGIDASAAGVDNELRIGSCGNILISGDIGLGTVTFNEVYTFPAADGASLGMVLATNAAGVLYWETPGGLGVDTIYSADATVDGNRNVDIDSFELEFTNGKVGFGTGGGLLSCAVVEFQSNTEGILLPRMTGVQVEAIVGPINGLVAFADSAGVGDITTKGFWGYDGTEWCQLDNCAEGEQEGATPGVGDPVSWDLNIYNSIEISLPANGTNVVQLPEGGDIGNLYVMEVANTGVAVLNFVAEFRFSGGSPVITTGMAGGERDVLVFAKLSAGYALVSYTAQV